MLCTSLKRLVRITMTHECIGARGQQVPVHVCPKGLTMRYEVRFQIGGEEQSVEVDVDDAATAAQSVQEQFLEHSEVFELIQVQLLDEMPTPDLTVDASK